MDGRSEGGGADATQCRPNGTPTPEPSPRHVTLEGGLPLDKYRYGLAVARCSFESRCWGLSTYAANNCVDQITTFNTFGFPPKGVTSGYLHPRRPLLQAAAAGVVRYDAQQASRCIAALLAEGCSGGGLVEEIPDCVGVFTCPPGADGGVRSNDGGTVDAGPSCAELVAPYNDPYKTCARDEDCAGVQNDYQGPLCVAGLCAPSTCGFYYDKDLCSGFVAAEEPCDSNALGGLNPVVGKAMCPPLMNCQGGKSGKKTGHCVPLSDVGGACTNNDSCRTGLACNCGICEIPPATGPCVNRLCEVGVAYCDPTDICRPALPLGASCDEYYECQPSLTCRDRVCQLISQDADR